MNDEKIDGILYIKQGNSYYKRMFSGPVHVKWFGAKGDGVTDDTYAIQKAFDSFSKEIYFDSGTYLTRKNETLTGFPNQDQPCLLLRKKNRLVIEGNNAVLKVQEHAQGILELQECSNVIIKNLKVIGPGNFPKLDGRTGRGEKGIENAGYATVGYWGYYKNNCKNTTKESRGGFNRRFPQFGGGIASTWGKWNGGFIGNVAYGILIHNACQKDTLMNCYARGFNYVGIGVGHNGDYFPKNLNYPYCKNIVFENCAADGNYGAGFHSMAVDGFNLTGGSSTNSGHPNSTPLDQVCDPGYGYTSRSSPHYTLNGTIRGVTFRNNKRKGIDAHSGEKLTFINNNVSGSPVCGIFAAWSSSTEKTIGTQIIGNTVEHCGFGPGSLGAIYVGAHGESPKTDRNIDALIEKNTIRDYSGSGIRVRYGNNAIVRNNRIENSIKGNSPNLSCILIVGKNKTDNVNNISVYDNVIIDQTANMPRGIQASFADNSKILGNTIEFGKDINVGLYTTQCKRVDITNNKVNLRGKGLPISVSQTTGKTFSNIGKGGK
ncbi:hypothetical protein GCM10023143_20670 [Compostibacter hankyongensis]|uniref:Pectate lyase superfamily protein domain-containing protein n=2 Tax=Compostibacter hankyongensis TaxID=1007089 RepID=A0ABP8FUW1_9BACT